MMFNKKILGLFVLLFLVGCVSASSVTCRIVEDNVLVEIDLDDGVGVVFSGEYSSLEVEGNVVSFIAEDVVQRDKEWIFALPVVLNSSYDLEVVLPSGYVLSDGLVYPKGYEISSDGKNIMLNWKDVSEEVAIFYEGGSSSYVWIVILVVVLAAGGFLFFRYQKTKFNKELERLKKKAKGDDKVSRDAMLTRNLFGEEKRILEFLIEKKSCWMKDLVRELGISKVMATRKVRSLIEKGLVEKENFGRENKITLVKTSKGVPSV